jgi:predicted nuclease of predicted toxin-antitoxin system
MRFFLDENFPKTAAKILIENGHDVFDIRGTSDEGSEDIDIFQIAQERNAIFLTTDKDYFHTIPHLYESHYGIIVITLRKPNRKNILDKLKWALNHVDLLNFKDKIILLRDSTYVTYER